jgi:hypothetical protein
MHGFERFRTPLTLAGFGVIAAMSLQAGACTDGPATQTESVTGVTGMTALAGSTTSVVPQREDALDAAAVTSGPSGSGATMPSGVASGVASGAGSVGTGR